MSNTFNRIIDNIKHGTKYLTFSFLKKDSYAISILARIELNCVSGTYIITKKLRHNGTETRDKFIELKINPAVNV